MRLRGDTAPISIGRGSEKPSAVSRSPPMTRGSTHDETPHAIWFGHDGRCQGNRRFSRLLTQARPTPLGSRQVAETRQSRSLASMAAAGHRAMAGSPAMTREIERAAGVTAQRLFTASTTPSFKESIMNKFGLYSAPDPSAISLRPRHAAAMLGISQRHLSRLTKAGEIPAAKAGRCTMYSVDGLKAWLASRMEGGIHAAH